MLSFFTRTAAMVVIALALLAASPTISNSFSRKAVSTETTAAQAPLSQTQNAMVVLVVAKKDDRAARLQKYLENVASPMASEATNLINIADKYDLDWTFLPAIAALESQSGKMVPGSSFNPYGWNNGHAYFGSWVEASDTVAAGIRSRYQPEGEVTAWGIGPRYAESGTWAIRVVHFQEQIALTSL
ncbi:MAG: hypothetical protein A3F35_01390 [Candidatus Woykebacteria bacterium RIFCSPHIGHO2_12_FULL_45_10]|uniref:Mannosyl-glycoprotein endo-beta-N-acetylglucosamidase-like domain-containing protein n=1 Tax=Candidatus Woykebacteria bacterium RIFCSPHIGHO2_12_FULL_45_10 TaxID=1802603 RepID=A0A1G1WNW1_9BACT|nr:MAG: hypothetical protein A3F35_01390 [Candidatus Woykebacteria bacterium RIFCSPHIGHO2_12_FULL_45_10]